MKVSIITPSYNSEAFIASSLKSVEIQKHIDIEHIIIDGNSSDDTMKIVSEFPHVRKWVSESDDGIFDAMNKGIAMTTGDVIGILNSDDFYISGDVIGNVAEIFSNDPSIDCLYADLNYVAKTDIYKIVRRWKSGPYSPQSFYYGWMPPHPTFFVRRELYQKYGNFNLSLASAADYELMLRFLLKNNANCFYLQKTIIHMRDGGNSNSSLMARIKANRQDKRAWALNGLKPRFYTLWLKPLRKITQFVLR